MQNEEKERTVKDIGQRLVTIGQKLVEKGEFKLGNSLLKPSNPSWFVMRYERLPKGELSLKLEIKWEENPSTSNSGDTGEDLEID